MAYNAEFLKLLEEKAIEFLDYCESHAFKYTKSRSGVEGGHEQSTKEDPYIATVNYFLKFWLPKNTKEKTIVRSTYYAWLTQENTAKSDTIKKIEALFDDYNEFVMANYGKGEFWAMNKKGWSRNANNLNKNDHTISGDIQLDKLTDDELKEIISKKSGD